MKNKVLIVDDEAAISSLLTTLLARTGYEVSATSNAAGLRAMLGGPAPALVLLDLHLQDGNGLDLLPEIKGKWPQTEVIILTGHATLDAAVRATKLGAYDFQEKPFENKKLMLSVEHALEHRLLTEEATSLRKAISTLSGGDAPVFQSPAMKSILHTVERVAPSDAAILITGESGTGKEVIADLMHAMSRRAKGPCVKINCAALPRELIESELFGAIKGSYTGALADREGLFSQAEGGTLLLDEIAEMPVDTQTKLLRVLQDKEFRPVGGRTSQKADCRMLASTNQPIEESIKAGRLRQDLFYRISAITIPLPPLRERREDILPLANTFLRRYAAQADRRITGFEPAAADLIHAHQWPGNVRQLQNEVQRAVLLSQGSMIEPSDLSITRTQASDQKTPGFSLLEGIERNTIMQLLSETGGNKVETARRLGIGRQTLYNKIKAYGIATNSGK